MTQCYLTPERDDIPCRCDNCDAADLKAGDLEMITDIQERLDPGCIVPAGQCPHCGALAYYQDEHAPGWTAQSIGHRLAHAHEQATATLDKAEAFIAGFEDDEMQEGIPALLAEIRAFTHPHTGEKDAA